MTEMNIDDWKQFVTKHNYSYWTQGAERSWFFVEGKFAFEQERYLASLLSYVVGIEACLRTFYCYHQGYRLSDAKYNSIILNNGLLHDCKRSGLQVEVLAFPEESGFLQTIQDNKSKVEIVSLRNDICHGNTVRFHKEDTFHPEHAKETAARVIELADALAREIRRFDDNQ